MQSYFSQDYRLGYILPNMAPLNLSVLSILIVSGFTIMPIVHKVYAEDINPALYPVSSAPYNQSYSNWIERWWQWIISIPSAENPKTHYSPQNCLKNQNGPVWFLPDLLTGHEERQCTIPVGKAILIPIHTGICWNDLSAEPFMPESDLKSCAMEARQSSIVSASVDGTDLKDLKKYRIQSNLFNFTIPKNNYLNETSGTFRSIVDGYFAFLKPLSPGKHDVSAKVNVIEIGEQGIYNQASDVQYHLNIK